MVSASDPVVPAPPDPRPAELVTVLDHVRWAVTRFRAAGVVFAHGTTDPLAEAAFVVCEALHLPPDSFDTFAVARVTGSEHERILDLIAARIRTRKPAAYLLGRTWLRGIPFHVDERTIVPRSYLAEIIDGPLCSGDDESVVDDPFAVLSVLDLCTGSGALAVLAALRFPNAMVDAVDVSAAALAVAAQNVTEHGLEDRITLLEGDLWGPVGSRRYDLIISNPPYVDAEGMAALPPECRHEPALALDGGPDGIAIVRRIVDNSGRHLTPDGGLLCEIGRGRDVLEEAYPDLRFEWIDTAESRGEVFWLDAGQLDD